MPSVFGPMMSLSMISHSRNAVSTDRDMFWIATSKRTSVHGKRKVSPTSNGRVRQHKRPRPQRVHQAIIQLAADTTSSSKQVYHRNREIELGSLVLYNHQQQRIVSNSIIICEFPQHLTGRLTECASSRFGADIRTLNVMIQTSASNLTIFSRSGPQGNVWRLGQVQYQSTVSYKVIFEGIGKYRASHFS